MLDVLRANIQLARGNLVEAHKFANAARTTHPELNDVYWLEVNIALKEMNFDEVLANLKKLKSKFNFAIADLTTLPDYAEFVKSPQYKEWLEYEKGK